MPKKVSPRDRLLAKLAKRRAQLSRWTGELNAAVKEASEGRAHHQGCMLGGLFTGMGVDCSGAPCWCGWSNPRTVRATSLKTGAIVYLYADWVSIVERRPDGAVVVTGGSPETFFIDNKQAADLPGIKRS